MSMRSDNIDLLATALAIAQGEMPNAKINRINPHFKNKYADLASVRDAIHKVLSKHGLSFTQTTEIRDSGFILLTTLMHSSGQWIASEYPLPSAAKPQELGSALTYARRYSLTSLIGISADEDDDAEDAQKSGQKNEAKVAKSAVEPQKVAAIQGGPQAIPVHQTADMKADWIAWGGQYLASLKTAKTKQEAEEWNNMNASPLDQALADAPKVYQRITDNAVAFYNSLEK